MTDDQQLNLVEVTADIAAAFVSNNRISARDLPELISAIHKAFSGLGVAPAEDTAATKPAGAVSARKSLASPEHIISMIDGKAYKTLTRHIGKNGYTADSYREAFGLPAGYPMTAPAYSEKRSAMALAIGLGRKRGKATGSSPAKRGRKPKAARPT